jgi:hypothetical protein
MKSYILFAFGEYLPESKTIDLIVDFVTQISNKDVKFQYGQSGIIVTFESDLEIDKISQFLEENIIRLTAMYFVFPVSIDSVMSMDDEIYEHLFGEGERHETTGKTDFIGSYFKNNDSTLGNQMVEELFQILFNPNVSEPTLDEILDKIGDVGMEGLSTYELKKLEEYSKK